MTPVHALASLALLVAPIALLVAYAPPAVSLSRDEQVELAVAYMRLKVPNAEQAFAPILEAEPNHRRANFAAGMAAIDAGRSEDAIKYLQRVLDQHPDDHEVALSLGAVYHNMGRLDEAGAVYRRLRERHPEDARVVYNLALLDLRAGREREALGHLETYLKMPGAAAKRAAVGRTIVELRTRLGLPIGDGAATAQAGGQ